MTTLEAVRKRLLDLAKAVSELDDEEKLEFLVEKGKSAPTFPQNQATPQNRVPGCISDAYVIAQQRDGHIYFQAMARAVISQGFVAILLDSLNGLTADEILYKIEPTLEEFLKKSKLNVNMIPSRMNAFANMFKYMQKKTKELL